MYNLDRKVPTEGQFVMIWENNGELFSDTFIIQGGRTHVYNSSEDEWVRFDDASLQPHSNGLEKVRYITIGEN